MVMETGKGIVISFGSPAPTLPQSVSFDEFLASITPWQPAEPTVLNKMTADYPGRDEEQRKIASKAKFQRHLRTQNWIVDAKKIVAANGTPVPQNGNVINVPFSRTESILRPERLQDANDAISTIERVKLFDLTSGVAPLLRFKRAGAEIELTLDPSQWHATRELAQEKFGCLTGAAGTGKTTVTRTLIRTIEAQYKKIDIRSYGRGWKTGDEEGKALEVLPIAFCAYTGKAMQQMKRALPEEYHKQCKTIHSLLGFHPEMVEYEKPISDRPGQFEKAVKRVFVPYYTAHIRMPWHTIYVDEASMVPIKLWNMLLAACKDDCRIFLIGDINQLPPVHGRSVFGFAMLKWPSFELTHIHRQKGEDNPIIDNAWKILRGEIPRKVPGRFDMVQINDYKSIAQKTIVNAVKLMHSKGNFDPKDVGFQNGDMLITAQNKGELGQLELNDLLIPYFNPPPAQDEATSRGRRTIVVHGFTRRLFAIGDKVMCTQNNHEIGITNGMTGEIIDLVPNGNYKGKRTAHSITEADMDRMMEGGLDDLDLTAEPEVEVGGSGEPLKLRAASHILTILWGKLEDGTEHITSHSAVGDVSSLIHAYASTCHKCQGSEFPVSLIVCHSANHRMLYREWLYTAVTRASKRVVLLYNERGLNMALTRQRIKGANLKEKAIAFNRLMDEGTEGKEIEIPELPNPTRM